MEGVHEESAEVCCSVQHCLKRYQLDDANGSCLHHLTRCTKLLHQLQGMACTKELADVLCATSIAYLQLYLLTRCHYRGGLDDCSKEIRTVLNKLCSCLHGSHNTSERLLEDSLPKVVNDFIKFLNTIATDELMSVKWILLLSISCGVDKNVTAAKDILCQFNWPKGSVPHDFDLLPTLSSVDELLRVTRHTDTSDRALREEESNAMDTSVHNPSHKHSNIVQAFSFIDQQEYALALEVIYWELKTPHCNVESCHLLAGWCHIVCKRYNLALLHVSKCLTGTVPLPLVLMYMALCYQKLQLEPCELETWKLLVQAIKHSDSKQCSLQLPKVYVSVDKETLTTSHVLPYATSPSLHEAELMLAHRLLSTGKLSEASTHLLQAIRELPCQSLNTGRLTLGVPALFLTAVRTLFLQNSFHEAETLCDELLTSYEGVQQCDKSVESLDCSVQAEACYLKARCLLIRQAFSEAGEHLKRCMQLAVLVQTHSNDKDVRNHSKQMEIMAANSSSVVLTKMNKQEEALMHLTTAISKADTIPVEMMYNYCQLLKYKGLCVDSYTNWLKERQLEFSNQDQYSNLIKEIRERIHTVNPEDSLMLSFDLEALNFHFRHKNWTH